MNRIQSENAAAAKKSLKLLEETKDTIEANLPALLPACTTPEQREQLTAAYNTAFEQWGAAVNATLEANDDAVQACMEAVAQANKTLGDSIRQAETVSTVIDYATCAVSAGTKLLGFLK